MLQERTRDRTLDLSRVKAGPASDAIQMPDHDAIKWNRIMISSFCLSMISAQTRFAIVARQNKFPLFRIMP